ncbi:MAG: hypothetical protein ACTHOE_01210 [Conexibacter sp.]
MADALHGPAGALADILHGPAGALPDVLHRPAGALADILHRTLSTLADVLDRALGALAHVFDGVSGALTDLADALARAGTDLLKRASDALKQRRVAIEGGQYAIDDRGDVIEASAKERLRFDPSDAQLGLAELGVNADAQLDEIEHLGMHRDARLDVVQLEVDLVDLDDRDVDENVGLVRVADRSRVEEGVVLVLALGDRRVAGLVAQRASSAAVAAAARTLTGLRRRTPAL